MEWLQNNSLQGLHTFGTQISAERIVALHSVQDVQMLMEQRPERLLILGGGSNVLFRHHYTGTVALNRLMGIEVMPATHQTVLVKAMAGVPWQALVEFCIAHGYGGLENLTLIPGCTGASPMQNIGAYGVEIKDVFHSLEAVHRLTGQVTVFNRADCCFGYRDSVFKNEAAGQYIITSVTFSLTLPGHHVLQLGYGAIQQVLALQGITDPTIAHVSAVVAKIRRSKLPDPRELGNAGSFFKNPLVSAHQYERLQRFHTQVPGYVQPGGDVKLAAAWLIEQSGFKGLRQGPVGCHPLQPLVLVNYGGATGNEILSFAEDIVETVEEKFGVELEMEVNVVE